MKEAVKFFAIVYAVFIGIILVIYYFGDIIFDHENFVVIQYSFILCAVLYLLFQKPVRKNKIWIPVKKFNWIFAASLIPTGLLRLYFGYKDPDDLLFGFVYKEYAFGIAIILIGLIGFLFFRYIFIDKKGIRFEGLTEFSEIKAISVTKHSLTVETDTDETTYKIFELSDKDLMKIKKRIDAYRNEVSHK